MNYFATKKTQKSSQNNRKIQISNNLQKKIIKKPIKIQKKEKKERKIKSIEIINKKKSEGKKLIFLLLFFLF